MVKEMLVEQTFTTLPEKIRELLPREEEWVIIDTPSWVFTHQGETLPFFVNDEVNPLINNMKNTTPIFFSDKSIKEDEYTVNHTQSHIEKTVDYTSKHGKNISLYNFNKDLLPHLLKNPENKVKVTINAHREARNNFIRVIKAWFNWNNHISPAYEKHPNSGIAALNYVKHHPIYWFCEQGEWKLKTNPFLDSYTVKNTRIGIESITPINYQGTAYSHNSLVDTNLHENLDDAIIELAKNMKNYYKNEETWKNN